MGIPMSKAGKDIARRMSAMASAVERGRRDTLMQAGKAGKAEHVDLLRKDSGGDLRLSGVGKRGAKIGARFDLDGTRAVAFKATGPVHFLANPMSPHRIPRERKTNRAKKRYAVIPGVGVRAYANHPGTRGKDSWKRAEPDARTEAFNALRDEYANIIRRAMR